MQSGKVLVVDPDAQLGRMLGYLLPREGFTVEFARTAAECLACVDCGIPDALILERELPDRDGTELCRQLTGLPAFATVPVIVTAFNAAPEDRYAVFDAGALDFVAKPFDQTELVWRLRAHLSHHRRSEDEFLKLGELVLDARNHVVRYQGREVALTPSECAILKCLLGKPGRAIAIETLLVEALGYPPRLGNPEVVRTHIRALRIKLENALGSPCRVTNVPRVGYLVELAGAP